MDGGTPAPLPAEDLDTMLGLLLDTAAGLLERNGGFHPFAGRWREGDDAPELLRGVADEDFPAPEAVLAELVEALRLEAEAGLLRCAATCLDVVVDLPDAPGSDAVRVNVEHRAGAARAAYLPYRVAGHRHVFGDMVQTPGDSAVFVERVS